MFFDQVHRRIARLLATSKLPPGKTWDQFEVLFTLLAERYECSSVLPSSNLPFSQWEQIFRDSMTTAVAIDRLVHHSVIVELNIPSYRLDAAKRAQHGAPTTSGESPTEDA